MFEKGILNLHTTHALNSKRQFYTFALLSQESMRSIEAFKAITNW